MSARAAWYPDPEDAARLRYWGGVAWTAHTIPAPVPPTGRGSPAEPRPQGQAPVLPSQSASADAPTTKQTEAAWRGYALVGVSAAVAGGLAVALATRAAPRVAQAIASALMTSMAARMREGGCDPPEL